LGGWTTENTPLLAFGPRVLILYKKRLELGIGRSKENTAISAKRPPKKKNAMNS
jgi:hypothetical protein